MAQVDVQRQNIFLCAGKGKFPMFLRSNKKISQASADQLFGFNPLEELLLKYWSNNIFYSSAEEGKIWY